MGTHPQPYPAFQEDTMHQPRVCLSVCLPAHQGQRRSGVEQHPHHISCNSHRRDKSLCQEKRGSLSVSSAAHERWIYHGFPFLPCFI